MSSPNNSSPSPNKATLKTNHQNGVGNSNSSGETPNTQNTHLSPNSGFASGKHHIHHKSNLGEKKNINNKLKGVNKYRPKTNKNQTQHKTLQQVTPATSRFTPNKYQYNVSEMIKIRDAKKYDPKPSDLDPLYCYNEKGNLHEIKLEQLARSKQKLQEKKMKESFFINNCESDDKKEESKRFEKKRIPREGNFATSSQPFSRKQIPSSSTNSRNNHNNSNQSHLGIDRYNDETFNVTVEQVAAPFSPNQLEKATINPNTNTNTVGSINTTENISNIANRNNESNSSQLINKNLANISHHFPHDDNEDADNVGWEDDYFSMSLIDNHTDDTSEADHEDLLAGSKLMKWKQNQPKEETTPQEQPQETSNILSKLFSAPQPQPSTPQGAAPTQGFFPPHSTPPATTTFSGEQFMEQFKHSIHANPVAPNSPQLQQINLNVIFGNQPPKAADNNNNNNNNNNVTSPRAFNANPNLPINNININNNTQANAQPSTSPTSSSPSLAPSSSGSVGSNNSSQGFSFSDFVKNVNMNQAQSPYPMHMGNMGNFPTPNAGPMPANAPMQWPTQNKSSQENIGNTLLSMLKNPKGVSEAATPVNNSFELPHVPFHNFYKNNYATATTSPQGNSHPLPNTSIPANTNNINPYNLPPNTNNYGMDLLNSLKKSDHHSNTPQQPNVAPQKDSLSKLFPPVDTSHFTSPLPNISNVPPSHLPPAFPIGGFGGAPNSADPLEKWFGKLPVPHMGGPLVGSHIPVTGLSAQEIENKLANK